MQNSYVKYWKHNLILGINRSWKRLGIWGISIDILIGFIVGVIMGEKDVVRIALITVGVAFALFLILSIIYIFFIVPFQENSRLLKTISILKSKKKDNPNILELIKLRKSGIELRNRGIHLSNPNEVVSWIKLVTDWIIPVLKHVKKISKIDAGFIETLGTLPIGGYSNAVNDYHRIQLNVFDERLNRLDSFLKKYTISPN